MASASRYEPAMGFSQYTCLPACSAATVTGMCRLLCRQTSTASMSSRASSARKSVSIVADARPGGDARQLLAVDVAERHDPRAGDLLVGGQMLLADLPHADDADADLVPSSCPTLPGARHAGLQSGAWTGGMLGRMTGRERVLRLMRGEPMDALPNMAITMMKAADEIRVPYKTYAMDADAHARGQTAVSRAYGIDHVSGISDPAVEASDLGRARSSTATMRRPPSTTTSPSSWTPRGSCP